MLNNSISTLGMTRRLQGTMTELQIELTRANDEVATGVHYDVAADLGARTGRDISLRNMFDRTDEYLKTTTLLDGRMGTLDTALTNILTSGNDLLAAASTGLGNQSPTGMSLQTRARSVLDQVVSMLNTSSGSVYLFAGTDVNQPPMRNTDGDGSALPAPMQVVKDAITAAAGGSPMPTTAAGTASVVATLDQLFGVYDPATAPPLANSYEGTFYTGTTAMQPGGTPSPRISGQPAEQSTIDYGIQANDPEMRELMEGIYMLASMDTSQMEDAAYPDYIQAAVDKLSHSLGAIRDTTAQLGIQRAEVSSLAEYHQTQKAILTTQIDNMEAVDPYEANTRITQLEAQIDATSSATASISKMHLTNYL